jgi:hypothetical protein
MVEEGVMRLGLVLSTLTAVLIGSAAHATDPVPGETIPAPPPPAAAPAPPAAAPAPPAAAPAPTGSVPPPAAAAPASAPGIVKDSPPRGRIANIVRSIGLHPIGPTVVRGPTVVQRAANRRGELMRVVLDGRSGEVLLVIPVVERPGGGEIEGPPPRYRPGARVYYPGAEYLPPDAPPTPPPAGAKPPRAAAAEPPLPRRRPPAPAAAPKAPAETAKTPEPEPKDLTNKPKPLNE